MPSPALVVRAVKELGWKPAWLYARYQLLLRSGWLRLQTPVSTWEAAAEARPAAMHFGERSGSTQLWDLRSPVMKPLLDFVRHDPASITAQAEAVLSGRFRFFGRQQPLQAGFPPPWNSPPALNGSFTGEPVSAARHWSRTAPAGEDIKLLWELSRFSWAFDLARGFAAGEDIRYYEAFCVLLDSWQQENPPNAGPQWISGQEVALRLMAVVFASRVFARQLEHDQERDRVLQAFLAFHAARLPSTLLYARAQGNNHLVSEAAGLYIAGLALPGHRSAARWKNMGRRWLLRALRDQVFPDGGYVQHSHTYSRLVLQTGLLGAVLAQEAGDPLPEEALAALRRMAQLLFAFTDPASGRVPNFGPNDGALLLPLSAQPIGDFRPTVQAALAVLDGRRAYPPGPWDELALWLGAGEALQGEADPPQADTAFPQAGLHLLAGQESKAVLRCVHFSNRPGHSDQLHLDLWWGLPLAVDAGTCLYNAPDPWNNSLTAAAVHNTLTINGEDPMRRAGRFLMLDWAQGSVLGSWVSQDGRFELLAAEHDGYRRMNLVHRRSVLRVDGMRWVVVDDVLSLDSQGPACRMKPVGVCLNWMLPDYQPALQQDMQQPAFTLHTRSGPVRLEVQGSSLSVLHYYAGELLHGPSLPDATPAWGWVSPTYSEKHPAHLLKFHTTQAPPLRLVSLWTLGGGDLPVLELDWLEPGASTCALRKLRVEEIIWEPQPGGGQPA